MPLDARPARRLRPRRHLAPRRRPGRGAPRGVPLLHGDLPRAHRGQQQPRRPPRPPAPGRRGHRLPRRCRRGRRDARSGSACWPGGSATSSSATPAPRPWRAWPPAPWSSPARIALGTGGPDRAPGEPAALRAPTSTSSTTGPSAACPRRRLAAHLGRRLRTPWSSRPARRWWCPARPPRSTRPRTPSRTRRPTRPAIPRPIRPVTPRAPPPPRPRPRRPRTRRPRRARAPARRPTRPPTPPTEPDLEPDVQPDLEPDVQPHVQPHLEPHRPADEQPDAHPDPDDDTAPAAPGARRLPGGSASGTRPTYAVVLRVAALASGSSAVLTVEAAGAEVVRTDDGRCTTTRARATCQISGATSPPSPSRWSPRRARRSSPPCRRHSPTPTRPTTRGGPSSTEDSRSPHASLRAGRTFGASCRQVP